MLYSKAIFILGLVLVLVLVILNFIVTLIGYQQATTYFGYNQEEDQYRIQNEEEGSNIISYCISLLVIFVILFNIKFQLNNSENILEIQRLKEMAKLDLEINKENHGNNDGSLNLVNNFSLTLNGVLPKNCRVDTNRIDYNTSKGHKEIGKGSFGVVLKAEYLGSDCAIKIGNQYSELSLNEAKCHLMLSGHKNVVQLFGCFDNKKGQPCYVMELMSCSLLDHLYNTQGLIRGQKHSIFKMLYEIVDGVKYMHFNDFAHGDLHIKNILVKGLASNCFGEYFASDVKISDFGFCKYLPYDLISSVQDHGCLKVMSPEVIARGRSEYGKKDDIYSLGILIWIMFAFINDVNMVEVLERFNNRQLDLYLVPDSIGKVIKKCLGPSNNRPSIEQLEIELKKCEYNFYCDELNNKE